MSRGRIFLPTGRVSIETDYASVTHTKSHAKALIRRAEWDKGLKFYCKNHPSAPVQKNNWINTGKLLCNSCLRAYQKERGKKPEPSRAKHDARWWAKRKDNAKIVRYDAEGNRL